MQPRPTLAWVAPLRYRGAPAPDPTLDIIADAEAEERRHQWCVDALKLVRPPSDPTAAPKVLAAVQNFMEDAAMFEWAGVGFGKQESFHIAMSLRKLASEYEYLDRLRLWGKILGTGGDYYVAEGRLLEGPTPGVKPALPGSPEYDVEPSGEGANLNTYWVSIGGSAPWVRLPLVRASHVVAARKIKQLMTGDLGSPVLSTPWFPGKERHLLRAQIARITASCTLAVSGFYEADPGDEEGVEVKKNAIREAEGALEAFPDNDTLGTLEAWVHAAPSLLSVGKTTWPDIDGLEEGTLSEDAIAAINAQKEAEPEKGILEGIAPDLEEFKPEDAEGSPAWNIKAYGDKGLPEGAKSHRVTAVRSLIWPGAITVAQGTRFANLYVGYGLKTLPSTVVPNKETNAALGGTAAYSLPPVPEDVMEEPEDLEEQEEPQPLADDASDGQDIDPQDDA